MAERFVGKWKLEHSDNFDNYMKQVGVGLLTRKAALLAKPILEFEVNGNHWKMTSASKLTTWTCEFDLGKEFEMKTMDGRKMKSVFTFEGGKLIQRETKISKEDKDSTIERYVDGNGQLIIDCESGGVKASRRYSKA